MRNTSREFPGNLYHNPRTNLRTYILTFPGGHARLELMTRLEVEGDNESQFHTGFIHLSFSVGNKAAVDNLTAMLSADGYERRSVVHEPQATATTRVA